MCILNLNVEPKIGSKKRRTKLNKQELLKTIRNKRIMALSVWFLDLVEAKDDDLLLSPTRRAPSILRLLLLTESLLAVLC